MTTVLHEMTTLEAHAGAANLQVNPEKATGSAQGARTRTSHGATSAIVARNRKTMPVAHREVAVVVVEALHQEVADLEVTLERRPAYSENLFDACNYFSQEIATAEEVAAASSPEAAASTEEDQCAGAIANRAATDSDPTKGDDLISTSIKKTHCKTILPITTNRANFFNHGTI